MYETSIYLGLGKVPLTNVSFWKLTELSGNEQKELLTFNALRNKQTVRKKLNI